METMKIQVHQRGQRQPERNATSVGERRETDHRILACQLLTEMAAAGLKIDAVEVECSEQYPFGQKLLVSPQELVTPFFDRIKTQKNALFRLVFAIKNGTDEQKRRICGDLFNAVVNWSVVNDFVFVPSDIEPIKLENIARAEAARRANDVWAYAQIVCEWVAFATTITNEMKTNATIN